MRNAVVLGAAVTVRMERRSLQLTEMGLLSFGVQNNWEGDFVVGVGEGGLSDWLLTTRTSSLIQSPMY
jgi:hypothetical protein